MTRKALGFDSLSADDLNDENSVHTFLSTDALMNELHQIRIALKENFPDTSAISSRGLTLDASLYEAVLAFTQVCSFSNAPSGEAISSALHSAHALLPSSKIEILLAALYQVSFSIESASVDHNADTFAVSHLWHLRWEQLLTGVLRPAYVGNFSVLS